MSNKKCILLLTAVAIKQIDSTRSFMLQDSDSTDKWYTCVSARHSRCELT